MASGTDYTAAPPASMAATPGITPGAHPALPVGSLSVTPEQGNRLGTGNGQGVASMGVPNDPKTPPAPPVLFTDIDGALLLRVHPQLITGDSPAMQAAMAAGKAAFDAAMTVLASAQQPVEQGFDGVITPQPEPTEPPAEPPPV